jgi:anti-sigma factor ChrR (cupin superfamily)
MSNDNEPHPDENQLTAFGLGALDEASSTEIQRHIAHCDTCRQVLGTVPETSQASLFLLAGSGGSTILDLTPHAPAYEQFESGYEILDEVGRGGRRRNPPEE